MEFSTEWLAETFPGYQGAVDMGITISEVHINASQSMDKGLFVPMDTKEDEDQSDLLKKAISNGAVAAIWDKQIPVPKYLPTDFPLFLVDDKEFALKKLAQAYLSNVNPKVVCIAGAKGAGMTKQWIASVLAQQYEVYQADHLVNSDVDLSLCLLSMSPETKVCIVDFALNGEVQMQDLSYLAQPDIGVLTNVSHDGDSEDLIQKSVEIFAGLKENGFVILDGDEPVYSPLHKKENVITCGFHEKNNSLLVYDGIFSDNTQFTLNGEAYTIQTADKSIMKFVSYVVMVGKTLGLDQVSIQRGLSSGSSND